MSIVRPYSQDQVARLTPSVQPDYAYAKHGSQKLKQLLSSKPFVRAMGALTGAQAVQMAKAGLDAIYLSGWQVAADANLSLQTYPDQSLYPSNSVPSLVKRLNNALTRAELVEKVEGVQTVGNWYLPIVADAEAGFGGVLHSYELMRSMIEAGAAAVHFEDQLAAEKKCGHLGGKVLVPTSQFIKTLVAARLASDVCGVESLIIARTDALSATLLTSDIDERDQKYIVGTRTAEGFYQVKGGLESAIDRGLAYAPYADLVWFETSTPDLGEATEFAQEIRKQYPGKMLAYNCSPSFNWKKHLSDDAIASFQDKLGELGYKYQFITLAGWHSINHAMFDLAKGYQAEGMPSFVRLQEKAFQDQQRGFTAVKHQREVGVGYFDEVLKTIVGEESATAAMKGSTEHDQF